LGGSFYGLPVSCPIDLGLDAYIRIAYDTYGIREFFRDKATNPADLLDGFYVDDTSHLTVTGSVAVVPHVPQGFFSVDVQGGLMTGNNGNAPFTITFDDPNQATDGGKNRVSSLLKQSCFFDATGEIDAGLSIEVKIGFSVFNTFIGVSHDFEIAQATLFS